MRRGCAKVRGEVFTTPVSCYVEHFAPRWRFPTALLFAVVDDDVNEYANWAA